MRPTQPQSSWFHYAKAAAVFTLTTATYLLARTTGWLPGWFSGSSEDTDKSSALTTSSTETSLIPMITTTDLQTIEFSDLIITEEESDQSQISSTQRRLLQQQTQQSSLRIVNPIPDQIAQIGRPWNFSVSGIFSSSNPIILIATQAGQPLPAWLSFQPKLLSTYLTPGGAGSVAMLGSAVFVAGSGTGLEVLDMSNPSAPILQSTYPAFEAGVIRVSGSTVFIADSAGLQILNMSNTSAPVLRSIYRGATSISDVAISGSAVFVADWTAGLQVLDVSNLSQPILRSTYPAVGADVGVVVSGSTVFVADDTGGLRIFDVSNLNTPILKGTYPVSSSSVFISIALSGSAVFITDYKNGIQILDVSNISRPILRSIYPVISEFVAASGSMIFISDRSTGGLQMLDVSNLSQPILLSTYQMDISGAQSIAVSGSIVFVGPRYGYNLQVLDLSQGLFVGTPPFTSHVGQQIITLTAQDLVTGEKLSSSFRLILDNFPYSLQTAVSDQSVFPEQTLALPVSTRLFSSSAPLGLSLSLSLQGNGVKPACLSLIPNFLLLSSYSLGNYPAYYSPPIFMGTNGLAVSGTTLFVTALFTSVPSGLWVLDVSNPTKPILLSTYQLSSQQTGGVVVSGSIIFVADGPAGLQVLNVSNLSAPVLLSTYPAGSGGVASSVAVSGSIVFVADGAAGLQVLNVSNLSAPILLSTYPAGYGGYASNVVVSGSIVFVADGSGSAGLQVLNMSNLSAPILLSTFSATTGFIYTGADYDLVVLGSTVVVANIEGLQVLDVSNLSAPILRSRYVMTENAYTMLLLGSTAFINTYVGFQVLDVSNLSQPILLSTYSINSIGYVYGLAVSGSTIFVADNIAGLQILDMSQQTLTITPSMADVGNYPMRLTATDSLGGSSYIDFTVRVEGPPQLNGSIPLQRAWVGQSFTYFVPTNLFVDPNNDVISYSANLINGKLLPSWLKFNSLTISFSGVPQVGDVGNLTTTLLATDHICTETPTVNFTISVGFLPVLSQRIPNQLASIGSLYQFSVPKNSFYDPVGLALSYLAQGVNNQPLPNWLQFNSSSLLFFGVANTSNITVYTLQLLATNSASGQVIASFTLRTDHFPAFNKILSLPLASVNQPWVWTLPDDVFTDADGDLLTYSATQEDSSNLPSWLSFNPITRTFTGLPLFTGIQDLKMTAQDSYGGSNSTYFNITIIPESQVDSTVAARVDKLFVFQVNVSSIFGSGETLSYGASLPSWLQFISNTASFSGLPNRSDVGSYDITLTATDSQGIQYNISFVLNVNPNYPPQVYLPISNQVAQVGESFVFFASQKTFVDPNDDNLTYTVNPLPSWLSFDPQQLKFWGTPGRSDTDPLTAHVVNVELTAHDDESQTSTLFTISVQGTSNLLLFLQIGVPLLSGLMSLYKAYQNRALVLNRCCRNRIVKHEAIATTGEEFHVNLTTEPKEVGKLQVKLPKPEETKSTAGCCSRLFRPCKRVMEESPDHLPPAYPLPIWLKYSDSNRLFSTSRVPQVKHPQFTVQVLNRANVIREELNVTVQAARL